MWQGCFHFYGDIRSRLLPQAIISHSSTCSLLLALVLCFDQTDQMLSQPAHRKHQAIRINENHRIKCKHTCTDIEIQNLLRMKKVHSLTMSQETLHLYYMTITKPRKKNSRILYHLYHPTVQLINTIYKSKRE